MWQKKMFDFLDKSSQNDFMFAMCGCVMYIVDHVILIAVCNTEASK